MKKMSAYIMIITLLAMNVAGAAYASCTDSVLFNDSSVSESIMSADYSGDQNQDSNQRYVSCDGCATGHHYHHSQASILNGKVVYFASSNAMRYNMGNENYLSQLKYPPSRPPRA